MASYRMDRTSEDILRELTAILRTVKDPRVNPADTSSNPGNGLISIVRVELANDMSCAKVLISSTEGLDAAKEAVKGLTSAAGYMRRCLGTALKLRHVPELRFVADDSIAHSADIAKTLLQIEREREARGED